MSLAVDTEALAEMQVGLRGEYRTESVKEPLGVSNYSSFQVNLLPVTDNLLEQVVARDNMLAAMNVSVPIKGAPGIDHRSVHDLKGYLQEHWGRIKEEFTYRFLCKRKMNLIF